MGVEGQMGRESMEESHLRFAENQSFFTTFTSPSFTARRDSSGTRRDSRDSSGTRPDAGFSPPRGSPRTGFTSGFRSGHSSLLGVDAGVNFADERFDSADAHLPAFGQLRRVGRGTPDAPPTEKGLLQSVFQPIFDWQNVSVLLVLSAVAVCAQRGYLYVLDGWQQWLEEAELDKELDRIEQHAKEMMDLLPPPNEWMPSPSQKGKGIPRKGMHRKGTHHR